MTAPTGQHPQPDLGVRLERRRQGSVEVVVVEGVLDVASAPTLRSCLLELSDEAVDVELELSGLDFVDSTGIGVLVAAAHRLRGEGHHLVVTGARPAIRAVLEVTGVDRLLSMAPRGARPSGSG
jgi:anti-sigma B factor antagonist